MQSKTPQFDTLMDQILAELVPHTRMCIWEGMHQHCEGEFVITSEDIEFLKMFRVPAPKFCPTCRRIRRFGHMNMTRLFKRPCEAPEHTEMIISTFPEQCPFPVYDHAYMASHAFDPFSFGLTYQENTSPLEQLFTLRQRFPMPSFLNRDPSNVNSEYSSGGRDNKNCYYTSGCFSVEDVWYSGLALLSREVMDSREVKRCDTIYEVLGSDAIYKSAYIYFSKDCSDSMFLFDCRNCTDCFGCVNLRNKRYCIWNEQKTKEEYLAFMEERKPFAYSYLEECKKLFWELVFSLPINASRNVAVENVFGTLNKNSRNLYNVTSSSKAEHIRHADGCLTHRDSMDVLFSGGSERLYQITNVGSQSSNVKFSVSCKFTTESEFVFNSKNLLNCFMCFGLENKSYCIFNKQYPPEEYWPLVDTIKTEMLKRGEYGEAPELSFSAQAYNFSMGQFHFPLTRDEIERLGGYVALEPESTVGDMNILEGDAIPQKITEVDDSILDRAILCKETRRPFRIIASELAFYRKMGLPLPRVHPTTRMQEKFHMAPVGRMYPALCEHCGRSVQSMYPAEKKYHLYCEVCFQQKVV